LSSPRCRRTHRAPPKPGSLRQFCCPAPCPSPLEFMAARSLLSLWLPVHARECLCIGTCVYECMFECMHACMLPFPSNLLLKHGNPGPSSSCWTWPSDAQHPSGALAARMRDGAKQTCRRSTGRDSQPMRSPPSRRAPCATTQSRLVGLKPGLAKERGKKMQSRNSLGKAWEG